MSRRLAAVMVGGAVALGGGGCCRDVPVVPPGPPRKVAVLVAAEMAEPINLSGNIEFWYDTVLTYCMLRNNGFRDEDIYVLYGNGQDAFSGFSDEAIDELYGNGGRGSGGDESADAAALAGGDKVPPYYLPDGYCGWGGQQTSTNPPKKITDFPMTLPDGTFGCSQVGSDPWKCRPKEILDCLRVGCDGIPKLGPDDYLFVWWKGHGSWEEAEDGGTGGGRLELAVGSSWGQPDGGESGHWVTADDVLSWIGRAPASHRLLVFETCDSGCLAHVVEANCTAIVLAACECGRAAYASEPDGVWHGVFSFWMAGTLGGSLPPNSVNRQGIEVKAGQSVEESFTQTRSATSAEVKQEPVKVDDCCLAPDTHLLDDRPVGQRGPG